MQKWQDSPAWRQGIPLAPAARDGHRGLAQNCGPRQTAEASPGLSPGPRGAQQGSGLPHFRTTRKMEMDCELSSGTTSTDRRVSAMR